MTLSIVILAAGNGKRMNSKLPKVLHPLGGTPLLLHVVNTAQSLNPEAIYIVYGNGGSFVREALKDLSVTWIEQKELKGTGHALLQAIPHIDSSHRVLVLYGDVPLIKSTTLQKLLDSTPADEVGLLVAKFENPTGFGRIIRDQHNNVTAIVEHKDASEAQLLIQEINTGILTTTAKSLKQWLPALKNNNAQGEYYLTDIISLAAREKINVISTEASCAKEVSGVNDRIQLSSLERYYQLQKATQLQAEGVTILDPARFDVRGTLVSAQDVCIDVGVVFEGRVILGEGSTIGAHCVLKNVTVGSNVEIKSHSVLEEAVIADNCIIGPFARIRPNTILKENVHIGNFVELKNTEVDSGSKVNHLTYLGDAFIGKNVNVGAGTITCNYDGVNKHRTHIQDDVFIGSGTELVAPLTIEKGAYIGAGSTITKDAPAAELTLGRAKQITIKGWRKKSKLNNHD